MTEPCPLGLHRHGERGGFKEKRASLSLTKERRDEFPENQREHIKTVFVLCEIKRSRQLMDVNEQNHWEKGRKGESRQEAAAIIVMIDEAFFPLVFN